MNSDIDLFLITQSEENFFQRGFAFSDLRDWLPAIEPLVYTPEEWKKLTTNPSAGFWQSATRDLLQVI